MRSRLFRALLVCAAISGLLIHHGDTVRAVSGGVVISQVYGGGGENDRIPDVQERLHRVVQQGNAPASLAGMSVQYASSAGNFTQATAIAQRDASAGTGLPRAGRHRGGRLGRHIANP